MIRNLAPSSGVFTSNVFLVEGETTTLVDVGNDFDVVSEVRAVVDEIDQVVLTHTHRDHVGTLDAVREAFDAPVCGYDGGFDGVDRAIADETTRQIGDEEYVALHTPGHKNDHLCLYAAEAGVLFAGDLVFANGSFGRTDLEEGDRSLLVESIDRVLDLVDEDLAEMHAGHGPSVTDDPYGNIELARRAARF
ncbi:MULTISPECIES: MBL fold metallo-hydrolase [Halomicrobium]|uniref:Beta-lactamase domain protein n=2 Tax=Halomicrobium mukohataei TaxID=57705 RepID=C7NYW3_HALMD|nr:MULTISPECIES: MBL fold metallo-hydrolase [Halomicrobium]ACV48652.1 beta-lactamase domain protein [Halomicrobium mukohataei DSM 12286]QCD67051.1 MBL fold metallo-hydrolase [Halomicrobium mukohataei]QFR21861.1 MBL fold metallo-hydrolase [Halomicrobium sp. ZPS1]